MQGSLPPCCAARTSASVAEVLGSMIPTRSPGFDLFRRIAGLRPDGRVLGQDQDAVRVVGLRDPQLGRGEHHPRALQAVEVPDDKAATPSDLDSFIKTETIIIKLEISRIIVKTLRTITPPIHHRKYFITGNFINQEFYLCFAVIKLQLKAYTFYMITIIVFLTFLLISVIIKHS